MAHLFDHPLYGVPDGLVKGADTHLTPKSEASVLPFGKSTEETRVTRTRKIATI